MSTNKNTYRDTNFNLDHADRYVLLAQVRRESFAYAITEDDNLLAWENDCPLSDLKAVIKVLDAPYKKKIVGIAQTGFLLIPESTFNPEQVADAARFLDIKPNEMVCSQPLDEHNRVIYKTADSLLTAVTDKFPSTRLNIGSKGWITAVNKSDPSFKNIYLNLDGEKLEILNYKNGKLRFYNSYDVKNADDVVYFTSVVVSELQLQVPLLRLVLSGDMNTGDEYHRQLSSFFEAIEFNMLAPVKLPAEIVASQILSLAGLSLCV